MIPQELAARELAKADADIEKWAQRVAMQRKRLCTVVFNGPVDRDPPSKS